MCVCGVHVCVHVCMCVCVYATPLVHACKSASDLFWHTSVWQRIMTLHTVIRFKVLERQIPSSSIWYTHRCKSCKTPHFQCWNHVIVCSWVVGDCSEKPLSVRDCDKFKKLVLSTWVASLRSTIAKVANQTFLLLEIPHFLHLGPLLVTYHWWRHQCAAETSRISKPSVGDLCKELRIVLRKPRSH